MPLDPTAGCSQQFQSEVNGQGFNDILHFVGPNGQLVSWIDYQGLLQGNLTSAGVTGNIAIKPATSDAIQYVSAHGNDSNDGLSWGSAKGNADIGIAINAAIQALPASGGWVFLAPNNSNYSVSTSIIFDRPVHLVSAGTTFDGLAVLEWAGGASATIVINGAAGAASGSTIKGITIENGSTASGTVGIDIYNGQYQVTLVNVGIGNGGSVPFSVAGIRAGNNTSGSAVINLRMYNTRIATQAIGLQLLFTNEVSLFGCAIYNSSTANIQVGDSTHLTTNVSIFGGNIEQDTVSAPSVILSSVQGFDTFGVYTETTGGPWLQVPSAATIVRGVNIYGGRFEGNAVATNIFDIQLSTATLHLDGCASFGYPATSNWVNAHSSMAFLCMQNLVQDNTSMSYITGTPGNYLIGPGTSGSSAVPMTIVGSLVAGIIDAGIQEVVATASGSSDVISFPASTFITTAGVDATTLATPAATTDDGKKITVTDTGGHMHTITTAANKIAPGHHLVTFNGTAGSFVTLQAYQGLWYVQANSGVTIS